MTFRESSRRCKVILIPLILLLTGCRTTESSEESSALPKKYETEYFSISYPNDWEINHSLRNSAPSLEDTYGIEMDFPATLSINRRQKSQWDIPPRLYIVVDGIPSPGITTEDIALWSMEMTRDSGIEVLFISMDDCIIDGCRGTMVEYEQILRSGGALHKLQYTVQRSDGSIASITAGADVEGPESDFELLKNIIHTIKLFNPK